MSSTPEMEKQKKQNWQYVRLGKYDIPLFRAILCQKFIRRDHAIKYIFEGDASYAEIRIRKLKMFEYLIAVKKEGKPESYLLGPAGVEVMKQHCMQGLESRPLPEPQSFIEDVTYEHDVALTETRFILQQEGLCEDWIGEKEMKLGTQGERKVPDGFFTRQGKGIAVELEYSPKDPPSYRKIFQMYEQRKDVDFVFYICKNQKIMGKVIELSKAAFDSYELHRVQICCTLFSELVAHRREAVFKTFAAEFKLEDLLIP